MKAHTSAEEFYKEQKTKYKNAQIYSYWHFPCYYRNMEGSEDIVLNQI